METAKPVEVSQDALGWLLLDAEGHPVGEPDYYPSKRAAQKALRSGYKTGKIRSDVEAAKLAERAACAALLDAKAREFNRLRDPGMANHCRVLAREIRARTD